MGEILKGQILQSNGTPRIEECPCCGGEPAAKCITLSSIGNLYTIVCTRCGVQTNGQDTVLKEAIAKWNRRSVKETVLKNARSKKTGLYCVNCKGHISGRHRVSYSFCPYCGAKISFKEEL